MMGKTLFKLKFFSASLGYFDRIVQKGPAHPNYNETLQWLASLTHQPVDTGIVLEKIGKYNRQELEAPQLEAVRDELYFLLGKYNYNKGKFQEAVSLFNLVPARALLPTGQAFEGATYVRQYTAKPAVEAFKGSFCWLPRRVRIPKVKPFQDLANLSLARVFYSTGQFKMATKYFDRVSPESYDWPNSLFEASWGQLHAQAGGIFQGPGRHPHLARAFLR